MVALEIMLIAIGVALIKYELENWYDEHHWIEIVPKKEEAQKPCQ